MQHKSGRERENVQMVIVAQTEISWEGCMCVGDLNCNLQPFLLASPLTCGKLLGSVGNEVHVTAAECGSGVVLKLKAAQLH